MPKVRTTADKFSILSDFLYEAGIDRGPQGRPMFKAIVDFESGTLDVRTVTDVTISFHAGDSSQVRIAETDAFTAEDAHVEYILQFVDLKLDGSTLIVSSTSPKVGRYKLKVTPLS